MSNIYRSKYNQNHSNDDLNAPVQENETPIERELHANLDKLIDQLLDSFYDVLNSSKGSVVLNNSKLEDKDVYKSFQDELQIEVRTQSIIKSIEELIFFNENLKKMILLNTAGGNSLSGRNMVERLNRLKFLLEFKRELKTVTNDLWTSLN
ncbi:hypothetical protein CONCODRAFT_78671 [Conidiobolus coronatus NRRL 28638]|uniref:Mediator of RNA polymerase II transcription subunit 22 n=1 Tax=Conidiobolus coronatus (strain ATCC 28846 / CBS 209.66 / NRRL 28638) TaxID=796925 RepID=A0A137P747_CONC2|nr:hypothetical protein CONCODRAFT_78671 [Conidiobolus coronatus NRRL 28638]|eukprot:KXN70815.1 hypothetical protein CONCODRAFT_78671 [Conidiobolus coronatus NRRL 28638]